MTKGIALKERLSTYTKMDWKFPVDIDTDTDSLIDWIGYT